MSEFFAFISWWWGRRDTADRMLLSLLFWVLVLPVNIYFFGVKGLFVFCIGIAAAAVLLTLYFLGKAIAVQWRKFKQHKADEEEEILDRLKGLTVAQRKMKRLSKP